ncbi:MAG: hypothetical protein ACYDD1_04830 [Caulobacteraceae bacterium]
MDEPSWTAAGVVPLRLWRPDEVIASPEPGPIMVEIVGPEPDVETHDLAERLRAAERRAEAAEQDRDWWQAQHDTIMEDWCADVEDAKRLAARLAAAEDAAPAKLEAQSAFTDDLAAALKDLLTFFDPNDGSIVLQKDGRSLSDAFRRTASLARILRL